MVPTNRIAPLTLGFILTTIASWATPTSTLSTEYRYAVQFDEWFVRGDADIAESTRFEQGIRLAPFDGPNEQDLTRTAIASLVYFFELPPEAESIILEIAYSSDRPLPPGEIAGLVFVRDTEIEERFAPLANPEADPLSDPAFFGNLYLLPADQVQVRLEFPTANHVVNGILEVHLTAGAGQVLHVQYIQLTARRTVTPVYVSHESPVRYVSDPYRYTTAFYYIGPCYVPHDDYYTSFYLFDHTVDPFFYGGLVTYRSSFWAYRTWTYRPAYYVWTTPPPVIYPIYVQNVAIVNYRFTWYVRHFHLDVHNQHHDDHAHLDTVVRRRRVIIDHAGLPEFRSRTWWVASLVREHGESVRRSHGTTFTQRLADWRSRPAEARRELLNSPAPQAASLREAIERWRSSPLRTHIAAARTRSDSDTHSTGREHEPLWFARTADSSRESESNERERRDRGFLPEALTRSSRNRTPSQTTPDPAAPAERPTGGRVLLSRAREGDSPTTARESLHALRQRIESIREQHRVTSAPSPNWPTLSSTTSSPLGRSSSRHTAIAQPSGFIERRPSTSSGVPATESDRSNPAPSIATLRERVELLRQGARERLTRDSAEKPLPITPSTGGPATSFPNAQPSLRTYAGSLRNRLEQFQQERSPANQNDSPGTPASTFSSGIRSSSSPQPERLSTIAPSLRERIQDLRENRPQPQPAHAPVISAPIREPVRSQPIARLSEPERSTPSGSTFRERLQARVSELTTRNRADSATPRVIAPPSVQSTQRSAPSGGIVSQWRERFESIRRDAPDASSDDSSARPRFGFRR